MKKILTFILLILTTHLAVADSFSNYVASLKWQAREKGFSRQVVDRAFAGVRQLPHAEYHNLHQSQSVNPFLTYLHISVTPKRVERGRDKLYAYRTILRKVSKQYQVPEQYIVALWGLETDYGRVTAVSKEVAVEMAEGALKNSCAQISIATTGIAAFDNESENGIVWISCASVFKKTFFVKKIIKGKREKFCDKVIVEALAYID